jgi:hypothetical protein
MPETKRCQTCVGRGQVLNAAGCVAECSRCDGTGERIYDELSARRLAPEPERVRVLVEIDKADLDRIFGAENATSATFSGYLLSKIARSLNSELPDCRPVVGYAHEGVGWRYDGIRQVPADDFGAELVEALS